MNTPWKGAIDVETVYRRLRADDLEADDLEAPPDDLFPTERHLEDALVANPDILIEGLWLVGRQIPTDAGRIDLLGIDPDGALILFELKLGKLSRGSVSQAIEYAAFLTDLEEEDLSSLIANSSGRSDIPLIPDFEDAFQNRLGRKPFEDGVKVGITLVSQEYDEPSARSIDWLSANGIGIDHFLLYHNIRGNSVVFDVRENIAPPIRRWWYPPATAKKAEVVEWVRREAAKTDEADLFDEIIDIVGSAFPTGRWEPRRANHSLGLVWMIKRRDGKPVEGIIIRICNWQPGHVYLLLYDEALQYAPRKLRAALRPFPGGKGNRLGQAHGELRWIHSTAWDQHGALLRDALIYAGEKHRKATAAS